MYVSYCEKCILEVGAFMDNDLISIKNKKTASHGIFTDKLDFKWSSLTQNCKLFLFNYGNSYHF